VSELSESGEIIGESPEMKKVMDLVHTVAPTDHDGDDTGGERHGEGAGGPGDTRREHAEIFPIVTSNCGAMTESLLRRASSSARAGAFTGAQYRRKGRWSLADGGTLFSTKSGTSTRRPR